MKKRKWINLLSAVLGIALSLGACSSGNESSPMHEAEKKAYREKGQKLAGQAQQSLMGAVKKALQEGGPVHAVDYCNVEAESILDKESQEAGVQISRIARRNRNPANALQTRGERKAFEKLENLAPRFDTSLLRREGSRYVYYQPIPLRMTTCLKCHGEPEKEVAKPTLSLLAERYPEDQALHYALGDLRGAWKITFPEDFHPEEEPSGDHSAGEASFYFWESGL